jgi:hypothetical protein
MIRPTDAPSSVRTVAVCYHLPPADLVARLQRLASRSGARLRGVVVSNNPGHSLALPVADFVVIRGSNAHLDFSGYFEGLEQLLAVPPGAAADNVLFLNDSLLIKHAAERILSRVLGLDRLLARLEVPAIGGKLDPYRSICLRNPWSGHAGYVTSFCFILNALAQPAMRTLLDDAAADGVLSSSPLADPGWGANMPAVLRESIRAHLSYEGSPYLWRSGANGHTELTLAKARCVYFESRLSGAIGSDGAVLPINSGPRSQADIFISETFARFAKAMRGR